MYRLIIHQEKKTVIRMIIVYRLSTNMHVLFSLRTLDSLDDQIYNVHWQTDNCLQILYHLYVEKVVKGVFTIVAR